MRHRMGSSLCESVRKTLRGLRKEDLSVLINRKDDTVKTTLTLIGAAALGLAITIQVNAKAAPPSCNHKKCIEAHCPSTDCVQDGDTCVKKYDQLYMVCSTAQTQETDPFYGWDCSESFVPNGARCEKNVCPKPPQMACEDGAGVSCTAEGCSLTKYGPILPICTNHECE